MGIDQNNVPASEQIKKKVKIQENGGKVRVLFIGNSITLHEPKPDIGWYGEWGMAASSKDKDYVHIVLKFLENKYGSVDYCIVNVSDWEMHFWEDEVIYNYKQAKDFKADIIIYRFVENVWSVREQLKVHPLKEHLDKFVKYFVLDSTKKVVMTSLFWPEEETDKTINSVASENGFDYVKINDLGVKDENKAIGKFEHSGVAMHPGDKGMNAIAQRIIEKLK